MHPFRDGDAFETLHNLQLSVIQEIRSLENVYVAKASIAELEQHFIDKGAVVPIVLHADAHYIEDTSKTKIDVSNDFRRAVFPGERAVVPGTRIVVAIPFEGDAALWRLKPSTYSLGGYPDIEINPDKIVMSYSFPDDSPEPDSLKQRIKQDVDNLASAVEYLANDVKKHNYAIQATVPKVLREKHEQALGALNAVASLGIPMKRLAAPATYTVPTKRRQTPVSLPRVVTGPYRPEPTLEIGEYEHILEILRSMALVMERSPQSFTTLDEEAIRTHFLLQLNGHYEGTATGETFNAEGKTDILIRVENRNIFIAECKFWRGSKSFDDAITQLLGYLSWKDSKCALLIFNRDSNSSAIRKKIDEIMTKRPEYRSTISHPSGVDSRYIVVKASDPGKEILITTMLFDVPGPDTKKTGKANN
ncbi:MAG: hypothetical protein L6437_03620 [Kiritimatiellae bacterium]|nr:hypothetical protein [Kiritimatiellia bacterium]